jgi:peptide/nickel transport system permease protein
MLIYAARRVAATIIVLAIVAVVVFALVRMAPGDPAAIIAGPAATTRDVAAIRAELGLDRPLVVQFATWLAHVARGDLGQSFFFHQPVTALIAARVGPTLALALATMVLSVLVAVPLGAIAAWKHGGVVDRIVMGVAVAGFSVPVFVTGYALVWWLAVDLAWLPVQGYQPLADGVAGFVSHLVLPTLALSVVHVALIARITRASTLDALSEDFIRTARAKGLRGPAILVRHALRNAAVPVVTVIGLGFALLVGGVVVTESVFAIPGLGRLTVDAVLARDYPTVQGVILLFALVYVLLNLAIDVAYLWLDPRIRY